MKKIIISGDLLRGTQEPNINLFYNLFEPAIRKACPDSIVEKLSSFDRKSFYQSFDLEPSDKSWLKVFYADQLPQKAEDILKNMYLDTLVIFIEAPQCFLNTLDNLNIEYLDLTIHPIRYMDDLLLGFRTNSRQIFKKLLRYQIDEYHFELFASLLKASFQRRSSTDNIVPDSALFLGQTPVDRSLMSSNGSIASILDYREEFENLGTTHERVYFKPHPVAGGNDGILSYLNQMDFVEIIPPDTINTYELFASDSVKTVCALSSGGIYEAKYFGKNIKYLFKQPFQFAEQFDLSNIKHSLDTENIYVSVYKDYFSPHFWADVLTDIVPTAKSVITLDVQHLHNGLRYALGYRWGYRDIQSISIDEMLFGATPVREDLNAINIKTATRRLLPTFVMNVYRNIRSYRSTGK